jgi:hypothetical protein
MLKPAGNYVAYDKKVSSTEEVWASFALPNGRTQPHGAVKTLHRYKWPVHSTVTIPAARAVYLFFTTLILSICFN